MGAVFQRSTAAGPGPFASVDLTDEVANATATRPLADGPSGPATIAGYTVVYSGETRRGVALADLPDGSRAMAGTSDPASIERMEREQLCGWPVELDNGELRFT